MYTKMYVYIVINEYITCWLLYIHVYFNFALITQRKFEVGAVTLPKRFQDARNSPGKQAPGRGRASSRARNSKRMKKF